VIDDFVAAYAQGETPNPCLRCNEKIKFSALLDRALALGFDAVCTGHYARLRQGVLRRAVDAGKDQSYVLAVLTAGQLRHAMFPLGDTVKSDVRADAGSGEVLARHDGVHGFTVGQRRGLGLGQPAADGRPRYVLGIEPVSGTVHVGPAEALDVRSIEA